MGLTLDFSEPDASSGLPVLDALAADELKDQPLFVSMLEQLRPRLDYDKRNFYLAVGTEDKTEGMTAVVEKRPPVWKNR